MVIAELSGDTLTAIAAFISGIGSVLTGWLALHYEKKRGDQVCKDRIDAFMKGIEMREGMLKSDSEVLKDEPDG